MKTRIIFTKFWEDSYILSLAPLERHLFNFLISNSRIGLSAIYECPVAIIQLSTGLNPTQIRQMKEKFQRDGKFIFVENWIKIINNDKYNQYQGSKNDIARGKELSLIPPHILKEMDTLSIGYCGIEDTSINHKSEIINHKSEIKAEKFSKKRIEDAFEKWWELYPRKIGKKNARDRFVKIFEQCETIEEARDLLNEMARSVKMQSDTEQWAETRFIPHPATWLNQERWTDRINPDEF